MKLKKKGFNVIYADAQDFNLNTKYDFIIAGEIIEHLVNFKGFFNSLKKHMHKNTRLIITTPNVWCAFNFLSILFRNRTPIHYEHTCWFCDKTFRQLVERFGFKVVNFHYLVTPPKVRFSLISRFLMRLGFNKLAGSALYFELSLK